MNQPTSFADSGTPARSRRLALWFGFLGPPLVWYLRLNLSYILVPYACAVGSAAVLNLVTVAALAAAAGVTAASQWRAMGGQGDTEVEGREARIRFMAILGVLSSATFLAVIAAEGLAILMMDPCQSAGTPL
jgi:hypothetical protein